MIDYLPRLPVTGGKFRGYLMKTIQRTSDIDQLLRNSFGEEADLTNVVVFEAIAANTNPIRQKGNLFEGGRISVSTLREMSERIEQESIPFQLNHERGSTPRGRVFSAKVVDEDLHVLIALNKTTESKTVEQLNSGIIDQVSVTMLAKKAICSECDFDYFSEEASFDNIWSRTCSNGHEIGKDGVHTRLVGVNSFHEVSGVGQGGVPNARIVNPKDSAFAESEFGKQLAASNLPPEMIVLAASPNLSEETMDIESVIKQLTASEQTVGRNQLQIETLEAQIETVKTQHASEITSLTETHNTTVTELNATIETLTAQVDAQKDAPSKEEYDKVVELLNSHAKRVLTAANRADDNLPDNIEDVVKLVNEVSAQLSAIIPIGRTSKPTQPEDSKESQSPHLSAFKTPSRSQ